MIKDPLYGMALSEDNAKAKLVYEGQIYYFCSLLCKQLFEREPRKYVSSHESHEKESSV